MNIMDIRLGMAVYHKTRPEYGKGKVLKKDKINPKHGYKYTGWIIKFENNLASIICPSNLLMKKPRRRNGVQS